MSDSKPTKPELAAKLAKVAAAVRYAKERKDEARAELERRRRDASAAFDKSDDPRRLEKWREANHDAWVEACGALTSILDSVAEEVADVVGGDG